MSYNKQLHSNNKWPFGFGNRIQVLSNEKLASCSNDKTIKIWDVRQEKSVKTIGGNPGRVSSLLLLNPTTLISASCRDNVYESQEKASLSFWDVRSF